jgi:hypothetical protein
MAKPENKSAAVVNATDLDIIINRFTEVRTLYVSATGDVERVEDPTKGENDADRVKLKWKREGMIALKIRPLNDQEMSDADEITSAVYPPRKKKERPTDTDEPDYFDPEYQKQSREARAKRRIKIILLGLVEPAIPGETFDEKAKLLRSKLPPRVLNTLQKEIEDISGGPLPALELANFT